MRRVLGCLAAVACLVVVPAASADPVKHFDTFVIECGGEQSLSLERAEPRA